MIFIVIASVIIMFTASDKQRCNEKCRQEMKQKQPDFGDRSPGRP